MARKIEVFFYGDTAAVEKALKKEGFVASPAAGDRKGVVLTKTVTSLSDDEHEALRKRCVELSIGGPAFDGIAVSGAEA